MSLVSLEFLAFVLIIAVIYFVLPAKCQWPFLLAVSGLFFYLNSSAIQLINLLLFITINFILSLIMSKQTDKRKLVFVCVIVFDILYLLLFKYFTFFMPLFRLFGISEQNIVYFNSIITGMAPMGISYIALIIMGYMAELYWEHVELQKNVGKFALFSCFFPHIISGPIVKYQEYDGNLWGEKHHFSYDRVISGIERIIWGVFKKLVVSSRAAIVADTIKNSYYVYTGLYVPIGVGFYIIQLYADFSGLMDIVIGISEILGIYMPDNFNTPFYAESVSDFWRRWHITLGRFLKEYVLFPMQTSGWFRKIRKSYKKYVENKLGKKYGKVIEKRFNLPRIFTMFVAWVIIGFWHGGEVKYIWGVGIYMWMVITFEEIFEIPFSLLWEKLAINKECFSWHFLKRVKTLLLYMFGVSFFWMDSLRDGIELWKSAFFEFNPWILFDHSIYSLGLPREEMCILGIGVLLMTIVSHIQKKNTVRNVLNAQNYYFRVVVYMTLIVMVICFGHYGPGFDASSFIYGKF